MDFFDYSDLIPLPLSTPKSSLCEIAYNDDYKNTLGLLRALLEKKEFSERAIAVTDAAISLNPAHYTVWAYRYDIVEYFANKCQTETEKSKYIEQQLGKNEDFAIESPKNYQIWNYRELLIKLHPNPNPKREFPLIEAIITEDNKNYHTWAYRTWLVQYFNLHGEATEADFVEKLLEQDVRNNSAWNYRYFLKFSKGNATQEVIDQEIAFAKSKIHEAPQNVSSWNYLLGVFDYAKKTYDMLEDFCLQFAKLDTTLTELDTLEGNNLPIKSVTAVEVLQKMYAEKKRESSLKALEILKKVDPIRQNYWSYKQKLLA